MTTTTNTRHPFAPLNPGELEEAVALVRATEAGSSEHIRFVMARLHEPSPEVVEQWRKEAEKTYPDIRGRLVPADIFDQVQEEVKSYRGGSQAK